MTTTRTTTSPVTALGAECECNDEFGPCEQHCTQLAQREGAGARSTDQLMLVFLDDALVIDPAILSPWGQEIKAEAEAAMSDGGNLSNWLDDADLTDALADVVHQVESALDAWVVWEDGYRIVRPTPDCPLLDA